MEKTVQSIASVSFFFLLVLGGLHISSSLLIAEGVFEKGPWVIFNSLDLPFLFCALLYGSSKISLELEDIFGKLKTIFIVSCALSAIFFALALYFNFGLTDASFIG